MRTHFPQQLPAHLAGTVRMLSDVPLRAWPPTGASSMAAFARRMRWRCIHIGLNGKAFFRGGAGVTGQGNYRTASSDELELTIAIDTPDTYYTSDAAHPGARPFQLCRGTQNEANC